MSGRIIGENVDIDSRAVTEFFEDRVGKYDDAMPLVSVLYQDSNPALAKERDKYEKETILPLLELDSKDSILDLGCGIGRWAEALEGKVERYHGTDMSKGLIDVAKRRFAQNKNFSFQSLRAQDHHPNKDSLSAPFNLIIIAGLFIYLNDSDCRTVLSNIVDLGAERSRIYVREPVGVINRLTLDSVWSEELKYNYSAIYRTSKEYLDMFNETVCLGGFEVIRDDDLFPADLTNRMETTQHYFILKRG